MTSDIRAYTTEISGLGGDPIEVYVALPEAPTPHGSVVVIHHLPAVPQINPVQHTLHAFSRHHRVDVIPAYPRPV